MTLREIYRLSDDWDKLVGCLSHNKNIIKIKEENKQDNKQDNKIINSCKYLNRLA